MEINLKIDRTKLLLWVAVAALAITVIILVKMVLFPSVKGGTVDYEQKVSALDSVIKYKDLLIAEKEIRLNEKDTLIFQAWAIIHYKDSLIEINQANERKHIKSYNQVPSTVRNFNKDALRRAVREFSPGQ
jgi:hypothetical protein